MARDIVQNLRFRKATEGFDPNAFSRILEQQYLKENRDRHMQKLTFAPSSIGYGNGTCPRYWFLAFSGAQFTEINDAQGIANMKVGSDAHARIQKLMRDAEILVDEEVEAKLSDPPVRGFIDVLIRWDGEVVVGEIKTTRQEVFMHRQTTMKPSTNHMYQILLYMKITGKKKGFLLYENKNDQSFLVIPVDWNEKNEALLEDALDWMRKVYANWQEGTLPTRPFRKNNKICQSCPVFDVCWAGEKGEVDIEAMPVPRL